MSAIRDPLAVMRSEEHTSELQSRSDLVCRLLLEKKKTKRVNRYRRTLFVHAALLLLVKIKPEGWERYGLKSWIDFFYNDTATTEIYTLSLHDALPIWSASRRTRACTRASGSSTSSAARPARSEEHTSELQSRSDLVCRLLLAKQKNKRSDRQGHRIIQDQPQTDDICRYP